MHTCTHSHMHTCTHARMHACTHARTHACTHAHMHTCTHAHMHTHTHATVGCTRAPNRYLTDAPTAATIPIPALYLQSHPTSHLQPMQLRLVLLPTTAPDSKLLKHSSPCAPLHAQLPYTAPMHSSPLALRLTNTTTSPIPPTHPYQNPIHTTTPPIPPSHPSHPESPHAHLPFAAAVSQAHHIAKLSECPSE